jgi:hypothetical protein
MSGTLVGSNPSIIAASAVLTQDSTEKLKTPRKNEGDSSLNTTVSAADTSFDRTSTASNSGPLAGANAGAGIAAPPKARAKSCKLLGMNYLDLQIFPKWLIDAHTAAAMIDSHRAMGKMAKETYLKQMREERMDE